MGVANEEVGYAEKLVAVNRYNPDILPDLETHVNHQVHFLNAWENMYTFWEIEIALHSLFL